VASKTTNVRGKRPVKSAQRSRRPWTLKGALFKAFLWIALIVGGYLLLCSLGLFMLRWVNPWFTTVQAQRRVESWFKKGHYQKRRTQVPLARISIHLQHAAVASEDARFYLHHGIDWQTLEKLVEEDVEEGKISRGGSTITQQLIKNLFATTHRNVLRKGLEFALAPVAEFLMPKQRILELYLNNIEWGPGVFGAEAAAQFHYHTSAANLSKEQSARLAVCIPSPLHRRPAHMENAANIILARMQQMGW
jgi:monofunctional biosynthetic peptidoglycan transglycosylase